MAANPRYANGSRRRKVREYILATQDICGICGQPVDRSLTTYTDPKDGKVKRHPMSAEIDEIIPISRGGSPYNKDNLQLAHRICNQKKSNRMPISIEKIKTEFPTSRKW